MKIYTQLHKDQEKVLIMIKGLVSSLETGAAMHIASRKMRMLTCTIVGISSHASTLTMDTVSLKTDATMHITSRKWRLLACLKTVL